MHSIIERHYLLLRVYIVLLFLKGNNIQYHLYQIPLKLNVYIRYVFWAGGLALRNKVMLCYVMLCYVMYPASLKCTSFFKIAKVINENVRIAFLYVLSILTKSERVWRSG